MKIEQVKRIGVIGCGVLGTTLAAAAAHKYEVIIKRRSITNGLNKEALQLVLRCFPTMVKRNLMSEEESLKAASHISVTSSFEDLKDCQIIFEAVPDNLKIKIENFSALNNICSPDTIFLGTSACISVAALAAGSGRPDKLMTAHFLTPVHIYNLVESVPALQTSQESIELVELFLKDGLSKTVVRVKDTPGLIQDYFFFAYFNHAIKALDTGKASVEDIDTIIKAGFGVRLGPFELMDHMGMSSQVDAQRAIYEQTYDKAFVPHPLLVKMVSAGYTGRIAGKGWYLWDEQGKKIGINKLQG